MIIKIKSDPAYMQLNMMDWWARQTILQEAIEDVAVRTVVTGIYEINENDMAVLKMKYPDMGDYYE